MLDKLRHDERCEEIYSIIYPAQQRSADDPPNFTAFVLRNITAELAFETLRYFGLTEQLSDKLEMRDPSGSFLERLHIGLDYAKPRHRQRLEEWFWHRQLFHAFDILGLTSQQVRSFCDWPGTMQYRVSYERSRGLDYSIDDSIEREIACEDTQALVMEDEDEIILRREFRNAMKHQVTEVDFWTHMYQDMLIQGSDVGKRFGQSRKQTELLSSARAHQTFPCRA